MTITILQWFGDINLDKRRSAILAVSKRFFDNNLLLISYTGFQCTFPSKDTDTLILLLHRGNVVEARSVWTVLPLFTLFPYPLVWKKDIHECFLCRPACTAVKGWAWGETRGRLCICGDAFWPVNSSKGIASSFKHVYLPSDKFTLC